MKRLNEIDFYLVTDSELSKKGTLSDVRDAVAAGCKIVQYRDKEKNIEEMIKEASQLKKICAGKAIFLINDNVEVAHVVDADGVHIGQEDMSFAKARDTLGDEKIIGLTVHNVEEAIEAEEKRADYIGLSPIFSTSTKKDAGSACGTLMIEKVKNEVKLPIIAIGGINKENIGEVIRAGADSAVAISAVVCADNVYREVKDFIKRIKENKNDSTNQGKG